MHPTINIMYNTFRENCYQCKKDCNVCRYKPLLDDIEKMLEEEKQNVN